MTDWSHPPDDTDVLPEPLRRDALRRRRIIRVGGVVVTAIVVVLAAGVEIAAFLARAAAYGGAWEWMR